MYGSPAQFLSKPMAVVPQNEKLINQHMSLQQNEGSYLQQPQNQHVMLGQKEASYLQQQAVIPTRQSQNQSNIATDTSFPTVCEVDKVVKLQNISLVFFKNNQLQYCDTFRYCPEHGFLLNTEPELCTGRRDNIETTT